jgi:hypothetical protein
MENAARNIGHALFPFKRDIMVTNMGMYGYRC